MKKLIVTLTVSTFALASALHASDTTPTPGKDKAACCDKAAACDKSKTTSCTDAKMACNDKSKSACCGESKAICSKTPSRRIAMSPKAAGLARQ